MQNVTCSIVLYKHAPSFLEVLIERIVSSAIISKLYLIDNSPTDDLKILADNNRIEYIFNNANIGYGPAHNIAMRKTLPFASYHIVLNPDVFFEAGTIEHIYEYMQHHAEVGHLMPKLMYPDGTLQYACKLLPAPADLIFRRFLPPFLTKTRMHCFEMRASGYNKILEVPYLSGSFMFLRVDALKKVGLFDERFFMYPEDIDLTRRIYRHFKTIFYPLATVVHTHERGSYKSLKLLWVHIVNMVKYFNKWGWFFDSERIAVNKKIEAQYSPHKNVGH